MEVRLTSVEVRLCLPYLLWLHIPRANATAIKWWWFRHIVAGNIFPVLSVASQSHAHQSPRSREEHSRLPLPTAEKRLFSLFCWVGVFHFLPKEYDSCELSSSPPCKELMSLSSQGFPIPTSVPLSGLCFFSMKFSQLHGNELKRGWLRGEDPIMSESQKQPLHCIRAIFTEIADNGWNLQTTYSEVASGNVHIPLFLLTFGPSAFLVSDVSRVLMLRAHLYTKIHCKLSY